MRTLLRSGLIRTAAVLRLDEAMLHLQRARIGGGSRVLVVEAHETLQRDAEKFRRQLQWVAERFTLISPETFFGLWDRGPSRSTQASTNWSKPAVLFTFDDGRESNYSVAAPLLEAMGTRGLFFVVPAFVGLTGSRARDFYYSNIDIRGVVPAASEEEWTPMSPDQLADLARRGHSVGSHTLSHANLSALSLSQVRDELAGGAERIESWTRSKVEAFAWPYAWNAMNRQSWDIVKATHGFCFSPCPGVTDCSSDSPHLIWRTEIESYYAEPEFRFMYSGLVHAMWAGRRRRLRKMLET